MRKKILILFAHPALEKSKVNIELINKIQQLDFVTFRDLYDLYPEFDFDIKKEKVLLKEHDVIIYHHPFYWYSVPSILREWQDLVFEHGWAYGKNGHVLEGKEFMSIITTGAPEKTYRTEGDNHFTMRELLRPFEQTADLCKMKFLAPFVVHGSLCITPAEIEQHGNDLIRFLNMLSQNKIDHKKAREIMRVNENLNAILAK